MSTCALDVIKQFVFAGGVLICIPHTGRCMHVCLIIDMHVYRTMCEDGDVPKVLYFALPLASGTEDRTSFV